MELKNKYNILVTRPEHQAGTLCQLVNQQGWNAIRFPTLQIVAVENDLIKQQFESLARYQWIIFISVNAVNFAISANNGKIDCFRDVSIAAVGKATEKALLANGIDVNLVPEINFNTDGLLATVEMNNVKHQACLIVRGKGGRELLANCLRERGAQVEYMEVYARKKPLHNDSATNDLLQRKELHAVTITSVEALTNLLEIIDENLHDEIKTVPLIVISNRIKVFAEELGFKHIDVTENPGNAAIIKTVIMSLNSTTNLRGIQWPKK